jgi:Arc/MetJ family transcription regulator
MRTNVEIDDKLMAAAMEALGTDTKRETIEVALERAIRQMELRRTADLYGTVEWEGDLMEWRRDKDIDE